MLCRMAAFASVVYLSHGQSLKSCDGDTGCSPGPFENTALLQSPVSRSFGRFSSLDRGASDLAALLSNSSTTSKCVPVTGNITLYAGSSCSTIKVGECLKVDDANVPQLQKWGNSTFTIFRCGRSIRLRVGVNKGSCKNQFQVTGIGALPNHTTQASAYPCLPGERLVKTVPHTALLAFAAKQKATYDRGVGKIPDQCPAGWQNDGFGKCGIDCPAGFTNLGWSCGKPKEYTRAPHFSKHDCEHKYHASCQKWGFFWYEDCRSGFHKVACCICTPDCPSGTYDAGAICTKHLKKASCPSSHPEEEVGLCYKQCPPDKPHQFGVICSKQDIAKVFEIVLASSGAVLAVVVIAVVTVVTDGADLPAVAAVVGPFTAAVEGTLGFPVEIDGIVSETYLALGPLGWLP